MALDYTVTGLLAAIRRRAQLPSTATNGNTDADILQLANETLQAYVAPWLLTVRNGYLTAPRPQNTTMTAGRASYRLPARAIGNKAREVQLFDSADRCISDLSIVDIERRRDMGGVGLPHSFYLDGAKLTVMPTPNDSTHVLKVDFFLRPPALALASANKYTTITTIAGNRLSCTFSALFANGVQVFDFVKAVTPFDVVDYDVSGTVAATVATFTAPLHADISVGDYICLADFAPVPTLPAEVHPVLYQATVCKVLEALGDSEGLGHAERSLQKEMAGAQDAIAPRVDSETETVSVGYLQRIGFTLGGW